MARKDFDAALMVAKLIDMACQLSYSYLGDRGKEDIIDRINTTFEESKLSVDEADYLNNKIKKSNEPT